MSTVFKHLDLAVKQIEGRVIRGIASQQLVDGDGDVILVHGIDTRSRFERNPVLLANHDHGFNLGHVTRLWVESVAGVPALMFEAILLDPVSERQREVVAAIVAGARRGISVGVLPVEYDKQPVLDGQKGYTFRSVILLEMSSVSLPSCATCLIERKAWQASHPNNEIVLELADDPAPARCGCSRQNEIVLEVADDDPVATVRRDLAARYRAAAEAGLRSQGFHVGGDPLIDPAERSHVQDLMRQVILESIHDLVRDTTTTTLGRLRGRVD